MATDSVGTAGVNPFVEYDRAVKKGTIVFDAPTENPFKAYDSAVLDRRLRAANVTLQPRPQLQIPRLPADATYLNSEAGQDLLQRGLQDFESLSAVEKKQIKQAREQFPEIDAAFSQAEALASEDTEQQERITTFRQIAQAMGKASGQAMLEGRGEVVRLLKMFEAAASGVGEMISAADAIKRLDVATGGVPDKQTMQQNLSRVFTAAGVTPVKPGDDYVRYDRRDRPHKGTHTVASATATNLVVGAYRLGPELVAGLMDNPVDFAKGLITFIPETVSTILTALDVQSIPLGPSGAAIPLVPSDEEVEQARDELIANPLAVAMLGLIGVGLGRGRSGRRVSVAREAVDRFVKEGEGKVEAAKAKTKAAEEALAAEKKPKPPEKPAAGKEAPPVTKEPPPKAEPKPAAAGEAADISKPITQTEFDAVTKAKKKAESEIVASEKQIERLEAAVKPEHTERAKADVENLVTEQRGIIDKRREIIAEAEQTLQRPVEKVQDVSQVSKPKRTTDEQLTVQLRENQAKWAEELPELSRQEYETLAKVSPDELGAKAKGQLQELRENISESGQNLTEAMRELWGPELRDAPPKLREAVRGGLDVPEVSPGTSRAAAGGVAKKAAKVEVPDTTPPAEVSTGFETADASRNLGHAKASVKVAEQALKLEGLTEQQRAKATADLVASDELVRKYQTEVENLQQQANAATVAEIDGLMREWERAKTPEERKPLLAKAEKLRAEVDKFERQQRDIFGDAEIVTPIEQLGGGLGGINPFESLNSRLARLMRVAKEKRKQVPDGVVADEPSILIDRAPKDVGLSSAIRTPSNVFGVSPGQPARYGLNAQNAARDIILTERNIMVETGKRGDVLETVLRKVDKKDWGKKGEKFYDHVVDPTRDAELSPRSREAAVELRQYMEEVRQTIIEAKRTDIRPSVAKLTESDWRRANDLTGERLSPDQRATMEAAVDKAVTDRIPDDWGIENYLPQMHPGQWRVTVVEGAGELSVGSARTPGEALDVAMQHYAAHPELSPEAYRVTGKAFSGGDVLRVSRGRMHKVVKELADAADGLLTPDQVAAALRGTIGTTAGRTKFAGFLQRRTGAEGFSKDITKVLALYNQTFVRWRHLRSLRKKVQPAIDEIRGKERRPNTAAALEGMLDHLWGRTPSKVSKLLDATLQSKLSPVKNWVAPQALERWAGYLKGATVNLFLKMNPRFHFLNRLQRYQTTAPVLEGLPHFGEWQRGTQFYRSPEGKAVLDRFGIGHLTGGKILEGGRTLTSPKFREKARGFAPETSNQEIAYATMYKRAKDMGYSDVAANDYAFLKGNLQTQFLYLASDMPPALRGPIASSIFQFKRFQIKNLELGYDLLASRDMPGVGKWLGAQLMFGGLRLASKAAGVVGAAYVSAEIYQAIKEEHGKTVADGVAFGLPGLIGLDMSYSMQAIDTPFGDNVPEAIGNLMLSPMGSVGVSVGRAALDTDATETSAAKRAAIAATQRIPALKWIEALQAFSREIDEGVYEFRDPAGRLKFKGDLKDVIVKGLGGRTTTEGEITILTEGLTQVMGERDNALDHIAATGIQWLDGEGELDLQPMYDWNELYPEFPITLEAIEDRLRARYNVKDLDRWERVLKNAPLQMRYSPLGQSKAGEQ